jgi:hypothetical protein
MEPFNGDSALHKLVMVWDKNKQLAIKCLENLLKGGANIN